MPVSILLLLLGIALVQKGDWGFGHAWIILGLVGIAATIVTGAGYLGPQTGKLAQTIQAEGPDAPSVREKVRNLTSVSRIDLVVLTLVIFVMVTKIGS
jgi:hypothetical protein